jgi:hypothetical protein
MGAGALGRAEVVVLSGVRDGDRQYGWLTVLSGGED